MKRISRRNFLKAAGVGAAALGLAACGSSSSSTGSSTTSSAAASATPAEDVTIKVAAIETAYGSEMWQKVTEAFTAQTGIKVELTTDKNLEDVIGPSMQGGDYPDVIHLATGREAALTEQFIKGNLIADITDVLSMTVPGESKKVSEKIAGGYRYFSYQPLRRWQDLSGSHVLQPLRSVLQRRVPERKRLGCAHHMG